MKDQKESQDKSQYRSENESKYLRLLEELSRRSDLNHWPGSAGLFKKLNSLNDELSDLGRNYENSVYNIAVGEYGVPVDYVDEWSDELGWDTDLITLEKANSIIPHKLLQNRLQTENGEVNKESIRGSNKWSIDSKEWNDALMEMIWEFGSEAGFYIPEPDEPDCDKEEDPWSWETYEEECSAIEWIQTMVDEETEKSYSKIVRDNSGTLHVLINEICVEIENLISAPSDKTTNLAITNPPH